MSFVNKGWKGKPLRLPKKILFAFPLGISRPIFIKFKNFRMPLFLFLFFIILGRLFVCLVPVYWYSRKCRGVERFVAWAPNPLGWSSFLLCDSLLRCSHLLDGLIGPLILSWLVSSSIEDSRRQKGD